MSISRTPPSLRVGLGIFAAVILILFYIRQAPSSSSSTGRSPMDQARAVSGPIAGLDVSLSQPTASPPTVTVTVTNNNDHPVTILRYGSPLDGLALQLGLLSVTPAGADEPLDVPTIKLRRLWPPRPDMLVTIMPGKSATSDLVLQSPKIPMEKVGDKATVVLQGKWEAVWSKVKGDISKESLESIIGNPEVSTGEFGSDKLEITIE